MSRQATPEELDRIRAFKPQVDCKPGEIMCPFFSRMSNTFKFCGRNSKDCPCNGLVNAAPMNKENYRDLLVRIVKDQNEGNDLLPSLKLIAECLGMEITNKTSCKYAGVTVQLKGGNNG